MFLQIPQRFIDKIKPYEIQMESLQKQVGDPELVKDQTNYKQVMQSYTRVSEILQLKQQLMDIEQQYNQLEQESEDDPDWQQLALQEQEKLQVQFEQQLKQLQLLLIQPDPMDDRGIILEIRSGTGGDEASLFVADLFQMYQRFFDKKGWKVKINSFTEIELGGFKEIILEVTGTQVYAHMKYEMGTHRVQRVPVTESNGRLQTSAATVAVLPEVRETEIEIKTSDLKIDTYRAQGAGGQHVNTTDSAVRITHLPTQVVVACQQERSQIKNKAMAMKWLRAKLYEKKQQEEDQKRALSRKKQVGSGDRSERIRTYNFPQNRLTDHRINLTLYSLDRLIMGDLEELIEKLQLGLSEDS